MSSNMKHLEVVVVGAGIGGLATALALSADGHHVTVLDAVKEFAEVSQRPHIQNFQIEYALTIPQVGAGIRVSPNSSRLLLRWGVDLDPIKKETSRGNRFVDWKNNILLDVPYSDVKEKYGAPYYFIHRADLVDALLKATQRRKNITIKTQSKVVEYNYYRPAVKTEQGVWYSADLVISAEGIKSSARAAINGEPAEPTDTGDVAYRILVPAAPLLDDPEMRHLITEPWATHWMGPEGHAVGYPLRGGELFNIIIDITHNTDLGEPVGEAEWKKRADNTELIERFKDWCPQVRKLCSLTGEYLKWKLADLKQPLKRWIHPSGKVVLLGDACHPMMPYMAQGAAQAIEDAGTLRAALATYDNIPEALRVYERQRAPRAHYVAKNTRVLQEWLHLYAGPARYQRDEMMRHDNQRNPIFWAYTPRKDWLFGHDAEKLYKEEELQIPELPPMLPAEASVYSGKGVVGPRQSAAQSRL